MSLTCVFNLCLLVPIILSVTETFINKLYFTTYMKGFIGTYEQGASYIESHPDWTILTVRVIKDQYGIQIMSYIGDHSWVTNRKLQKRILAGLELPSMEKLWEVLIVMGFTIREFLGAEVIHFDYIEEYDNKLYFTISV